MRFKTEPGLLKKIVIIIIIIIVISIWINLAKKNLLNKTFYLLFIHVFDSWDKRITTTFFNLTSFSLKIFERIKSWSCWIALITNRAIAGSNPTRVKDQSLLGCLYDNWRKGDDLFDSNCLLRSILKADSHELCLTRAATAEK